MVSHYSDLPQELQDAPIETPVWIDGKLLVKRVLAVSPLTSRAYFDAVDLTSGLVPIKAVDTRAAARENLGSHYELSIHADMVKFKASSLVGSHSKPPAIGGKRGDIVGFSAASRKRLIEFMASVRYDTRLLFATLTYPDHFPVDNPAVWRGHFEAFRRRFERQHPNWRCIWRIELKERKSGEFKGFVAPHWHLLIFTDIEGEPDDIRVVKAESYGQMFDKTVSGLSEHFEAWSLAAWFEIVGSGDERHAQHGSFAVAVRNRRHAYKYIAKYVAKEDSDTHEIGRRWGRIGNFDNAPSRVTSLTRQQYVEFKRLARRLLKARSLNRNGGSQFHKRMARQPITKGCSIFGLGDGLLDGQANEDYSRLVYKMLRHVAEITGEPIYWLRC